MSGTITIPRSMFERIQIVIRHLIAKIEPTDKEAKTARDEAIALIQTVTTLSDDETMQLATREIRSARAERSGAQVLLELAKKAEREGWEGPSDLAENHDKYAAEAAEEDLKRIHDYYH